MSNQNKKLSLIKKVSLADLQIEFTSDDSWSKLNDPQS